MKDKLALMSMLIPLTMMNNEMPTRNNKYTENNESDEDKKQRFLKSEKNCNKSNWLKEFFYGDNSVWAINEKNALRKAKKLNYI